MTAKQPTIYDVARAAQVSKSLVSLVLQGSPRVSDSSRQAVEAAIARLGYRPNRAASHLASRSTRMIGVLIDDYTNLWFVELLRGLDDALGSAGYRLSVADTATGTAGDPVEGFLSARVDGLVVAMELPLELRDAAHPPIVIAGTRLAATGFDSAANDDARGAELAAAHLLGLGHRRLGHLAAGGGAGAARSRSFEAAVRAAGAELVSSDAAEPATESAGFEAAMRMLTGDAQITAIFAANDVIALGALGAARVLGIRVPEQLSVIGYDNTAVAGSRLLDLTTVDDRSLAVGREAGRLLLARLGGADGPPEQAVIEPKLVLRSSAAPQAGRSARPT